MAKKDSGVARKCKACGYAMIVDETIVDGSGDRQIKRTFWHCVNGECGHIDRIGDSLVAADSL